MILTKGSRSACTATITDGTIVQEGGDISITSVSLIWTMAN